MKKIKNIWVQQVAAWITIILFVYFILDKAFKLMISQPLLFTIVIVLGIISSSLIFSIHAYLLSKKMGMQQNEFETKQAELASKLQEGIASTIDHMNISISDLRTEIKSSSVSHQDKIALPDWLTGEYVMRYYDLSHDLLMQYVRKGLLVYPAGTDVLIHGDEVQPLKEEELGFEIENDDYSNYRFKKADIEKYIKDNT